MVKTYGNLAWNKASNGMEGEYGSYKGLAYSWLMNMDAKMFPALVEKAVTFGGKDAPEDYYFLGGHHFMEYYQGAGCDGQQGRKFARMLARECDFQEKDLMVVYIWAFPVFQAWFDAANTEAEWEIHDSTKPMPVATGSAKMSQLAACDNLPSAGEKLVSILEESGIAG
mmetsp:Transcript_4078/g.5965  ORF Transcript_4078/g.5965 Transcript_4078/m.5965 type:complete len:169 (-) Transcript_4078:93-599(-)